VTSTVIAAPAGREPAPGHFKGVPDHLRLPVTGWLRETVRPGTKYEDMQTLIRVMARLRIPLAPWAGLNPLWSAITEWYEGPSQLRDDGERLLDVIHVVIQATPGMTGYRLLDQILSDGGSAYAATERGIEDRVDPTAKEAFEGAIQSRDHASSELAEAWSKAYGRNPDASDAWDHSIKAVEAVLRPIVCPNNAKATFSNVIGDIRAQHWKLKLRGHARHYSVRPLLEMLEVMWPDPNRHGSGSPERPATIEEARGVVQLAVTVVQWGREGLIVKL
jgi:hypothetical protein